jgi:type IV pilus assembly protein PilE
VTRRNTSRTRGHTLIEVLAALAIVAILAALAQASHAHFVLAARRVEARAALTAVAAAQERHYLRHARYAERIDDHAEGDAGSPAVPGDVNRSSDDPTRLAFSTRVATAHYRLEIAAADAEGYRLEARPVGAQQRDLDCALFVFEATGRRWASDARGAVATRRCWGAA